MGSERALSSALTQAGVLAAGAAGAWAGAHGLYASALTAALTGGVLAFARSEQLSVRLPRRAGPDAPARPLEVPLLRALLNEVPAPLLLLEAGGAVRAVNRAARALFATEDRLAPPPPELLLALREAPAGGRRRLSLAAGTGAARLYTLGLADLGAREEPLRLAVLLDVQAEVHAAEAEALRGVLQVLSHELMNSLTPVTSLAETAADLLSGGPDEAEVAQAREALATIGRRAAGLAQFVSAYRAMARLPEPRPRAVDVAELVEDAVRLVRARPDAKGIRISLHRPAGPLVRVTDPDLVSQALSNLLVNAVEAAAETRAERQAAVAVSVAGLPNGARLEVRDTGPGVPVAEAQAVFLPLTTTKPGGSGVGLHLARSAMRSLGGEVTLEEPRPGDTSACFALTL